MIFYRAIEFSKLQYLLKKEAQLVWLMNDLKYRSPPKVNWWMEDNDTTVATRRELISSIVSSSKEEFFEFSAEYNSINGGRFNPQQSFGALYASNHPLVAALEVLYHQFESAYSGYKQTNKNKTSHTTNFNRAVPNKVEVKIVVFEFETKKIKKFYKLNEDHEKLQSDCGNHGFKRYVNNKFDRDFIFGNDYLISQILGCSIHSMAGYSGIEVPSARIDFEIQDNKKERIRNYVIPEKDIFEFDFDFTGRFNDFHLEIDCQENQSKRHDVLLRLDGDDYIFELQTFPDRKKDLENQIKSFVHVTTNVGEKKLREVVTQKYK